MAFCIQNQIQSQILFLGLNLSNHISCHWGLPPNHIWHLSTVYRPLPLMWTITIARLTPIVMGILWSDIGVPCSELSLIINDLTRDMQVVMELAPPYLNQLYFELKDGLLKLREASFTIHLATQISNQQST